VSRARLRRHVRSLSAEGRLSAWVLIFVPLVLGTFMTIYRRSYIMPLFTDPRGLVMLLGGGVLFRDRHHLDDPGHQGRPDA
jgi:tight adherence protein B